LPGLNGPKVIAALKSWNYECPTGLAGPYTDSDRVTDPAELLESAGCTAFHALLDELRFRIEENELAPSAYDVTFLARAPSAAVYFSIVDPTQLNVSEEDRDIYWDNPLTEDIETKYQVMGESLAAVGDFLVDWLGTDQTKWAWGELHGLRLLSDVGGLLGVAVYDNPGGDEPPFANDGGLFTVDVAYPTPTTSEDYGEFTQTWGASTRFVCEARPEGPSCTIQLPGGQSGHVESDNYSDLIFPYLDNTPMPLVFDIAEAEANVADGGRTVVFQ
jgi:acyl-homoserine lactone acylase PvdQ